VEAQGCTGAEVRPSASCSIKVGYKPAARGEHKATLRIEVTGASDAETVQLSGQRLL